jgi:outer membrane protein, heavy metal efflux system
VAPTNRSLGILTVATLLASGCAGAVEQASVADMQRRVSLYPPPVEVAPSAAESELGGGLAHYLAYALKQSPSLRASFERWRAGVLRISRARRLPEPILGFGVFARSVETRVGPQQARVSLQQSFPWPTKLAAGTDAAAAQAKALERRFDAELLDVAERVKSAYWRLWLIRAVRATHGEHLEVLRAVSESANARVATGATSFADQQQIDLAAARLEDTLHGFDEAERKATAQLLAAAGAPQGIATPTTDEPPPIGLPAASGEELRARALSHPFVDSFGWLAKSSDAAARREEADRYPGFNVGLDWIITGEATMANVDDSGDDALVFGVGVKVPLWQGSYRDSVDAARAEARAQRSTRQAARDRAAAMTETELAAIREAARRVRLYRRTLVPQAESAYSSVLGSYVSGRATVAASLIAQEDLLDLRVELDRARAELASAWARLERVVGGPVESTGSATERGDDARGGSNGQ